VLPSDVAAALASDRRLSILNWLKKPRSHFPPQVDGDLVRDGVCSVFIARKLGLTQATAHGHLKLLARLGLIQARRIKQWTFYRRDEKRIAEARRVLRESF
jgi:DNA-binding transcriptional ArsR family regulator